MINKSKGADGEGKPERAKSTASNATTSKPSDAPERVSPPARLFRKVDWITFAATAFLVFAGYFFTLAPDLTLEDSGELAVGSYYAGVPHPPGYPVWTLYTWLFTHIPFSNIAWRVALSSAVAGALSAGLLALIVSRGSSLLLEGIAEFKNLDRHLEDMICVVSGFVAGMIFGFNGFMWSQSVIVEVYTLSVLSFMGVLVCLLRWIYAPESKRYLYWALFWFGVCFTNHQTLIVAAMGIEVAILAAYPKLGRDMFISNSVVYLLGLFAKSQGWVTSFDQNFPLFVVYNCVGIASLAVAGFTIMKLGNPLSEWKTILMCGLLWLLGASFYFYMPLASMTNPPMNWGYPRTVEGFVHALTRGQYDQTKPTESVFKFIQQVWMYFDGARDEFSMVFLLIALIPFFFFMRMQKRERAWMSGLTAIYLLLAFLLLILLNPNLDKQSRDLTRVFFTASHIIIAIWIGYGLTLICGTAVRLYERFRRPMLWCGAIAIAIQIFYVASSLDQTAFPPTVPEAEFMLLVATIAFTGLILFFREKAPLKALLCFFLSAPLHSVMSNWSEAEQRGHLFGYWFGHDMFTPPFDIYPEMAREAILFGGTDPGRFNPTYMIFCESFIAPRHKRDPEFNRRDVYLITQNALADKTYLDYIRAHYNRSAQQDPYFFSELFRSTKDIEFGRTNSLARLMLPLDWLFTGIGERIEKKRRDRGVYPPKEISTPSTLDSQISFERYMVDAQRRMQHDMLFTNEPPQLKPGEDVRVAGGKVQVAGQVAVMAINGLLTKVIFDKNPGHEFYVEESFPLEWMFPHLTPFGIIMKLNREPLSDLPDDALRKDHEFWAKYSERLIGNWITYDTPIEELCQFAEKIYLRRDLTGFEGDRKFVRDGVAQKSFSKLRSAIAGLYQWRLHSPECPPQYRPKTAEATQRLLRETEFALKQAFVFCPYSPEAIYKYVQLLLNVGRLDEARLIAETGLKFDYGSTAILSLVQQLRLQPSTAELQTRMSAAQTQLAGLDRQFRDSPTNLQLGLSLASTYAELQQYASATQILDQIAAHPSADISVLMAVAQHYAQMGDRPKVDSVLERMTPLIAQGEEQFRVNTNDIPLAFNLISAYMVRLETNKVYTLTDALVARPNVDANTIYNALQVYQQLGDLPGMEHVLKKLVLAIPNQAEAWYDLAAVQVSLGKNGESLIALAQALQLNDARLATQPGTADLRTTISTDGRFAPVQGDPEFQRLMRRN